jgi:leader peptidase (prepilin peptidase) / N-methyltransferase
MLPITFGIFGLIIGSFLNVVIVRRDVTSLGGRSACMSCGSGLAWYDMVPVFSWLALRGRCRSCGSHISAQYPIVEALTAIAFAIIGGSALVHETIAIVLALLMAALLIVIAVYDTRHTIIPDQWSYLFALSAFAYMFARGIPEGAELYYWIAGPLAAIPITALWVVSRGRWIGLGDAKLCLGIGWLLGPIYGLGAVFFAFVIGAVVSVGILIPLPHVLRALQKWGIARFRATSAALTMKSEVAFGPFLIMSCFIVWFSILYNLPLPW